MTLQAIQPHNQKAAATWDSPGALYEEISRTIADSIEHCIARLQPKPGMRILDLACGTGWTSRSIARAVPSSHVTGLDLGADLVASARERAAREGLSIDYQVGDAESLPFPDASFDAVVSTCGIMFASHPEAAAEQAARVCRPGGCILLTTWRPDSTLFELFTVMKPYMPAPPTPPPPSPFAWGREERVQELLGAWFDLQFEEAVSTYRCPSAEAAWQLWSENYGPLRALAANQDEERRALLQRDITAFFARFQTPVGVSQPRTYLLTMGRRK